MKQPITALRLSERARRQLEDIAARSCCTLTSVVAYLLDGAHTRPERCPPRSWGGQPQLRGAAWHKARARAPGPPYRRASESWARSSTSSTSTGSSAAGHGTTSARPPWTAWLTASTRTATAAAPASPPRPTGRTSPTSWCGPGPAAGSSSADSAPSQRGPAVSDLSRRRPGRGDGAAACGPSPATFAGDRKDRLIPCRPGGDATEAGA